MVKNVSRRFRSSFYLHDEVQILIDRYLKSRRHQRRRERQLDHGRSFEARARSEKRVVVNIRVDEFPLGPGEVNFPPALFRRSASTPSALRLEARLGDTADRIDADRADLDAGLRIAGADAEKLFVFSLEHFLELRDP